MRSKYHVLAALFSLTLLTDCGAPADTPFKRVYLEGVQPLLPTPTSRGSIPVLGKVPFTRQQAEAGNLALYYKKGEYWYKDMPGYEVLSHSEGFMSTAGDYFVIVQKIKAESAQISEASAQIVEYYDGKVVSQTATTMGALSGLETKIASPTEKSEKQGILRLYTVSKTDGTRYFGLMAFGTKKFMESKRTETFFTQGAPL